MSTTSSRKVVLMGGSGFLGRGLRDRLVAGGYEVVVIGRGPNTERSGWRDVHWDAETIGPWAEELDGADALVHLAGKRVDCRPTRANIAELTRSRVHTVRLVGTAIASTVHKPATWVQLSSLARYGDTGDEIIDEATPPPDHGRVQQVEVCRRWEDAYDEASAGIARRVLIRPGISIGGAGDPATAQLARLARFGLGGRVGSGRQWVSWISAPDLFDILQRAVVDASISGVYHATSPDPVRNSELMAAYRAAVGRRFGLPSPSPLTTVGAWLQGSDPALALTGRRCIPTRLLEHGFRFAGSSPLVPAPADAPTSPNASRGFSPARSAHHVDRRCRPAVRLHRP